MPRITPVGSKKRKLEEAARGKAPKPRKRIRKQQAYHSSSEEEDDDEQDVGFAPVNLASDEEIVEPAAGKKQKTAKKNNASLKKAQKVERPPVDSDEESESDAGTDDQVEEAEAESDEEVEEGADGSEDEMDGVKEQLDSAGSGSDSDGGAQVHGQRKKSKRNDPEAFSTSISKILSTKLSSTQKADPVMARSVAAAQARKETNEGKLEVRAKARLRAEKQAAMAKGRTTDVLGIERGMTGEVAERERQLRKIATRGVIQLFNAFRTAHERAEQARKDEQSKGTVGMGERERKVGEVGKAAFLEKIGGKRM